MTTIRAAITQTTWTGDKESMLDKHEQFARDAAADGAQIICFQELFYGPYFGITQDAKYYRYAEPADGPIVQRFAALAKELNMVMILPIYEEDGTGIYYNTAVVVDADGTILGSYRKHHIPHLDKFWEKFYFRPGNLGYPVFDTAVGRVGVYICYDRHFPEGWRELGLNGAEMVFNPNATKPGLSNRLWEIEQPAAAVANQYYVLAPNRDSKTTSTATTPCSSTARARSSTRRVTTWAPSAPPSTKKCSSATSTSTSSRRCATTGSSTAIVVPTPTRRW